MGATWGAASERVCCSGLGADWWQIGAATSVPVVSALYPSVATSRPVVLWNGAEFAGPCAGRDGNIAGMLKVRSRPLRSLRACLKSSGGVNLEKCTVRPVLG